MSDTRGVSTALNYVLNLSIAALLVAGLLVAGSGFVEDSRESVVREELAVVGEQVAADIQRVDRLVVAGDGVTVASVTQEFPERVAGSTYILSLDPGAAEPVELSTATPNVTVTVPVRTDTGLGTGTAGGGPVTVRYDNGVVVIEDG